ncbi:MAG TPA: DUF6265 family protein [Vicinamibacterales bacterium]
MSLDARRAAVWLLVGAVLGGFPPVFAQPLAIDRVAWLHGCWQTTGSSVVEEQWMAPRGGTMIGMGRTVRGGKTTEYELVVLREQDSRLAYEAHPSGQPSAVFLSREITDSSVVFENAEHDFPQRVGYRRSESGLAAWIEGTVKGQMRHIDFNYARVACAK